MILPNQLAADSCLGTLRLAVFEGSAFGYELGLLTLKFGPRFTTAKKVLVATWAAATD